MPLSLLSLQGFRSFRDLVTATGYNCQLFESRAATPFAAAQPTVSEGLHLLLVRAMEQLPTGARASTFAALGGSPVCLSHCCRCFGAKTQGSELEELRPGGQESLRERRASGSQVRRGNTARCTSALKWRESLQQSWMKPYRFKAEFGQWSFHLQKTSQRLFKGNLINKTYRQHFHSSQT